jgi:hypothetical protein
MKITGKYSKDQNFTTIYSNNVMYTIARNTGDWRSRAVGDDTGYGILTQELYDKWESECKNSATFELED